MVAIIDEPNAIGHIELNALSSQDDIIKSLQAEIARLKDENGNMDSMYQDRLLGMEAKVYRATEDLDLRSKSYDANTKGWQEDIAILKDDLKRCTQTRDALAKVANKYAERERVLVDALEEISNHVNENSRIGVVIRAALAAKEG